MKPHRTVRPATAALCVSAVGTAASFTPSAAAAEAAPGPATRLPSMEVLASPLRYEASSSSAALFSDTPLIETPFSVSVYTEELMEDQRAFTLPEVLENDPSIALQTPGGYFGIQNLSLRGFRVDNFNGYRIDGLPIIQTVAPMLDDKARVEVLKGPAALRFGFMSPGGAINLVRKHPTPESAASLSVDANTFGNIYSQLDAGDSAAGGRFGYRVVAGGEDYDSFYHNAGGDRYFGSLYLEWKPVENLRVWGSFAGQDFERNGYYGPAISTSGTVLNTGLKTNLMEDWARTEQQSLDAGAGVEMNINESWKLIGSLNHQDSERFAEATYPYGVLDNGDFTQGAYLNDKPSTWDSWGWHAHVEGGFHTGFIKHLAVVGGEYRTYDSFTDRGFPDAGPQNAFNLQNLPKPALAGIDRFNYNYQEYGLFLTDTIEFDEHWSILLGTRYGDIDTRSDYALQRGPNLITGEENYTQDAWSPTAALMFSPVKNVHSYVTYTRGLQDGGVFADPNPANPPVNLGPQESEQWEAGVKAEWCEGRFAGELAVFRIEQDLPVQTASGWAFSGLQRHQGAEVSLRGKITDLWQAGVAAMLLDAEQIDTGNPALDGLRPRHVPEYQVNLWSVLDIPQVPGLALTAGARFVDKQFLDPEQTVATDSYAVVDLGARYRFHAADADWTVRLNVENALDERYFESGETYSLGTPGGGGAVAYGAPIAATLSLQVQF